MASITKNSRVVFGGAGWLLDVSDIATGMTVNNGGIIQRDSRIGRVGLSATPIKHQGRIGFARMFYGAKSRALAAHETGYCFVMATDVDAWEGGAYSDPSNTLTNPTGGLILRSVAVNQAGAWHDAGPLAARKRITPVNLTTAAPTLTALAFDPDTDSIFLILTSGAAAAVQLSQGGNSNDEVNTVIAGSIYELPTAGLGDTPFINAVLTATNLSADETLVGWLLTGARMGID